MNRVLAACTPLAVFHAGATIAYHAAGGSDDDSWTSCILAVPLALSRGIEAYSAVEAGSVQTAMYPPVWAAAFSPVGAASNPSTIVVLGFALAAVYCLGAIWLFARAAGGGWALSSCMAGALALVAWKIEPLWHVVYRVRPDAPALGFGLLACAAAVMSKPGRRWGLPAALLLAWMPVGSKQVMLPLVVALPLWIAWSHGTDSCRRLAAWWAATGAAVGLPWLLWIPCEGLWLNLVTIPSRCPWGGVWPMNLIRVAGELWVEALLPLAIMLAALAAGTSFRNEKRPWRDLFASPMGLLLIVAAANVPLSLLGRVKQGGGPNTLSPTIYFLWAGAVGGIVALCREGRVNSPARESAVRARAVLALVLLLAIPGWGYELLRSVRQRGVEMGKFADQRAFDFLRTTKRNVYFPLRPIVDLEASGDLFHAARAVYDREVQTHIPLSAAQIENGFPKEPEAVCWENRWGADYVRERYFFGYRRRVRLEGLEAFQCFAAGEPAGVTSASGGPTN